MDLNKRILEQARARRAAGGGAAGLGGADGQDGSSGAGPKDDGYVIPDGGLDEDGKEAPAAAREQLMYV